jgi:AcrR family transcriptional regulator
MTVRKVEVNETPDATLGEAMNATIPQDTQPKPRKEEILDVATHLFAEGGYDGTSMNDVAERVGMRKASLFYHFATKDALYEAVLDRLIASLGAALSAVYAGEGTFCARVERAADTTTEVLGTHPYAARLLLREAMDWGPVLRGKLIDNVTMLLESGAAFVRAGQDAGEFVEGDPKQLVLSTIGVHVFPFALGQLVERYMGSNVFETAFVEERRRAVRIQLRQMLERR